MALRGFSSFEARFRAQMAKSASKNVMVAIQLKDGLTKEEKEEYRVTFEKFDDDCSGNIDSKELGNLVRVLGYWVTLLNHY